MAQHGQQYGRQTDEYGNPIAQTEAYGGTNMGHQQHGTTGTATGGDVVYGGEHMKTGGGGMGTGMQHTEHQGQGQGMLHRSGSGSSSSSEDDGEGGRRKKGLKQKIKEKLPGSHEGQDQQQMHGTTGTGYGQDHQKMQGATGTGYGQDHQQMHGTTHTTTTGYGQEGQQDEKEGIMDKIKEKLPGGHN